MQLAIVSKTCRGFNSHYCVRVVGTIEQIRIPKCAYVIRMFHWKTFDQVIQLLLLISHFIELFEHLDLLEPELFSKVVWVIWGKRVIKFVIFVLALICGLLALLEGEVSVLNVISWDRWGFFLFLKDDNFVRILLVIFIGTTAADIELWWFVLRNLSFFFTQLRSERWWLLGVFSCYELSAWHLRGN